MPDFITLYLAYVGAKWALFLAVWPYVLLALVVAAVCYSLFLLVTVRR